MTDLKGRLARLGPSGQGQPPAEPAAALRARLDRLLGPGRVVAAVDLPAPARAPLATRVAGHRVDTPAGSTFVAAWTAPADHRHGRLPAAELGDLPWPGGHALFPEALAAVDAPEQVAFLDTETTGLAGGAGTVPFLVGVGRWHPERAGFRVVQLFLEDLDREAALLEALADELRGVRCVVTYNGRGFDLPLLENRHVLTRRPWPLASASHLDLLPPARTLWRHGHADCRLSTLEASVLGYRRVGDVPGAEIPAVYADYLRRGATERLAAVFRHNRDDLLSLAGLLWAAAQPGQREALGVGLLHARGGRNRQAVGFLERGLGERLPREARTRALKALVLARKRAGQWDEALAACADLRRLAPGDPLGVVAAAVILEHRVGRRAEALALVEAALAAGPWPPGDRAALERRLRRLQQKTSPARDGPPPG